MTIWHREIITADGTPYPTRNRLEDESLHGEINPQALGLSEADSRAIAAVHELGHAVVWMAGGFHVASLGVGDDFRGHAEVACASREATTAMFVGLVAGERAVDRWLRETALWTPSLAAMAELTAAHDRAAVFEMAPQPRPTFGDGPVDYSVLHDLADQALDTQWDRIMTALPALIQSGWMTGDQLSSRIAIPNPSKPKGNL
ncbi:MULTISPECIES: hypothetical protein [unclassified Streptomyces]|uniref:hypothetical protein n=1 Tax=unclassified Streptomyces TaxID=2593676 RepID=UPI001489F62B|nr:MULTISPECIES: hypothetical protein [unclassified Streptomyces]